MLSSTQRLLRLLVLLQGPTDWTGASLAHELGVTARTIRSDVERLRELGYPIEATVGAAGGYRLGSGGALPPLVLDDDEAVALALGLSLGANGGIEGIEETSVNALTKVLRLLPARLRQRVESLQSASLSIPTGPRVSARVLEAIAWAIRTHQELRFDHMGADSTPTRRRVEPYRLVHRGGRWVLWAFDPERASWATFRLDRMVLADPGRSFKPRPVPPDDRVLTDVLSPPPEHVTATVILEAPYSLVSTWWQPGWGDLSDQGDGTCLLRLGAANYETMAIGVGLSGVDFRVVEPDGFREFLDSLAGRFARAASGS